MNKTEPCNLVVRWTEKSAFLESSDGEMFASTRDSSVGKALEYIATGYNTAKQFKAERDQLRSLNRELRQALLNANEYIKEACEGTPRSSRLQRIVETADTLLSHAEAMERRSEQVVAVQVPREIFEAGLNYIKHCGANAVMRGQPHPQQQIVDGFEKALSRAKGE